MEKCPICETLVKHAGEMTTIMGFVPFIDKGGVYHSHNFNLLTSYFACANGHRWKVEWQEKCPNCEFGKRQRLVEVEEDEFFPDEETGS